MIFIFNNRKRRHQRYDVNREAMLEIETEGFHTCIPVPLINLSQSGALLRTRHIAHKSHHIAVAGHNDELKLIIHPDVKELNSKIEVKRYSWNRKVNAFDVGVEFKKDV